MSPKLWVAIAGQILNMFKWVKSRIAHFLYVDVFMQKLYKNNYTQFFYW